MSQDQREEGQVDLFLPQLTALPLRDQRETMERPFFSLSKRKRLKPIDYVSPDRKITVHVSANSEYGLATIYDLDILISRQANDADGIRSFINRTGQALPPPRAHDRPHPHFLRWRRENCFKQ